MLNVLLIPAAVMSLLFLVAGCSQQDSSKNEGNRARSSTSNEHDREKKNIQVKTPSENSETVQKKTAFKEGAREELNHSISGSDRRNIQSNRPVDWNREDYDHTEANSVRSVKDHPLSTFSIDVDSASYANTRRFLNNDRLPPADAVRIEELINYFHYDYPQPDGEHPFSITTELGTCPWNPNHELLHVGLQGKNIQNNKLPPSNLVFLIDVSGSMQSNDKLPLVKKSLNLLVDQLRPEDRISMVVYAGDSGVALEPTPGDEKERIKKAISSLNGGGSTAGSKGIKLAYKKAQEQYMDEGNNRIILATDGDFNVGITSDGALTRLIEKKRENGVFLSVLGFGTGNYQGGKMEKLSNKGNGNYAYIDSIMEAKKSLVREFGGSMRTIAKDVKIQLEFNPAQVQTYRLIGYVNRQLEKEDFRDDQKDAGELGSGHSVTALYELVPPGEKNQHKPKKVPELKYQNRNVNKTDNFSDEIGTVKFRYKPPEGDESILMTQSVSSKVSTEPSHNFHWSAAVAMFGMQLREDTYQGNTSYELIREHAQSGAPQSSDYRQEFLRMVKKAKTIDQASE